jgi:hypothetical protein
MCERLESMKDVGTIVKLQFLLSRLTVQSRRVSSEEVIGSEHSFDQVERKEVAVDVFSHREEQSLPSLNATEDSRSENWLVRLRKGFLHSLDSGSDSISVNYVKGGVGSVQSIALGFLFLFGFVFFLTSFGILSASRELVKYNDISQDSFSIEMRPGHLVFASINQSSQATIHWNILDGEFKVVGSAPFQASPSCSQYIPESERAAFSSNATFYCLSHSINIVFSKISSEVRSLNVNYTELSTSLYYL